MQNYTYLRQIYQEYLMQDI